MDFELELGESLSLPLDRTKKPVVCEELDRDLDCVARDESLSLAFTLCLNPFPKSPGRQKQRTSSTTWLDSLTLSTFRMAIRSPLTLQPRLLAPLMLNTSCEIQPIHTPQLSAIGPRPGGDSIQPTVTSASVASGSIDQNANITDLSRAHRFELRARAEYQRGGHPTRPPVASQSISDPSSTLDLSSMSSLRGFSVEHSIACLPACLPA